MGEPSQPGSGHRRAIASDVPSPQEEPMKRMRGAIGTSSSTLPKKKKTGRGKRFLSIRKSVEASRPHIRSNIVSQNSRERVELVTKRFRKCVNSYREEGHQKPNLKALKYIKEYCPSLVICGDLIREGNVPGVEIGDKFYSRAELSLVNLHGPLQAGIATGEINDAEGTPTVIATSIVLSRKYEDDEDEGDTLLYTGEGGRDAKTGRQVENQALTGGNLALHNSMKMRKPVRVIRSWPDDTSSMGTVYSYDGLYGVEDYDVEPGRSNFRVYKFKLVRNPGQPPSKYPPYVSPR